MKLTSGNATVDRIGQINFVGNIIPHNWVQWVRYSNKRGNYPDLLAIHILADIVYWYRPVEVRDQHTGHLTGWRAKFKDESLQRSSDYYAKLYGVSQKQARESVTLLEKLGLIQVERKSLKTSFGVIPTVAFITPVADEIARITAEINPETIEKSLVPNWEVRGAELVTEDCPNGNAGVPNWETQSAELGNSSIYKNSIKNSIETSHKEGNPPSPVPRPSPTQERACVGEDKFPETPETTKLLPASLTEENPTPPPTQELTRPDRAVRPPTLPLTVELPPLAAQVHPTQRCDRQFDPIAPWRISRKRNDYKFDFCTYLRTHYLPTVAPWRDATPPTTGDTKNWIARREYDEKGLSEIENKWGDFKEWQAEEAKKTQATIDAGIPTDQDEFIALMRAPDFLERTHPKYRRAG